MISHTMILAGLVVLAFGGLAFVLVSGDTRAQKRQAALQKGVVTKIKEAGIDKGARRKQVSDSLKELEAKTGKRKVSLQTKIQQAGLSLSTQQFFIASAVSAAVLAALIYVFSGSVYIGLASAIIGGFGLPNFVLARLRKRRIAKFINEFPNAMDVIVRGVKAGLPLGDCLRIVASEAVEPVRGEFRLIIESQAVGLSLSEAVDRLAERVPVTESNFFAIVINIQAKAGGNLSEALANLSRVLRERKKMKGKISAMSMEAKASAAIIGLIPFIVTALLYFSSPQYISLLWTTTHGRIIACIGLVWMSLGTLMMKKMITFDF
ncbi:MAG TPA: type II secretion system F family protein [Roseiarcus sp.]|nr:type II secretion system F family protein [Roseiarcus sp.]